MCDEHHEYTLTPLRSVSARLVAHDWAWAREDAAAIAENWARRRAARPAMFDGRVLLASTCSVRADECELELFETAYSDFIAFRDLGSPDEGVHNAFAAIVPHSADGAILLGIMGPHTANAGQVYFPCGTPDRDDLRADGAVDLAGSAAREFTEETGLELPPGTGEAPWLLVSGGGQLAFLRSVRFPEDSATLLAQIEAHLASEPHPELAGMVAATCMGDVDADRMPGFARCFLASVLDDKGQ